MLSVNGFTVEQAMRTPLRKRMPVASAAGLRRLRLESLGDAIAAAWPMKTESEEAPRSVVRVEARLLPSGYIGCAWRWVRLTYNVSWATPLWGALELDPSQELD